jgi:hypothetical protein
MSPVTHVLIGWSLANSFRLSREERAAVVIAAVIPDVDGVVLALDFLRHHSGLHLEWWNTYHHVLAHNIGFALFTAMVAFAVSKRRWMVGSLGLMSFHVHLICDVLGSKGPDGDPWPIHYLLPFSDSWQWTWSGQWELNAWQNFVITAIVTGHMFYLAWKNGVSPLEFISSTANAALSSTLRRRFGMPKGTIA